MNEHLWLTSGDPFALLDELYPMPGPHSGGPQSRKCRLYLLACVRRHWDRLPPVCRAFLSLVEVYADNPRAAGELRGMLSPIAEALMQSGGTPEDLQAAEADLALLTREQERAPNPLVREAISQAELERRTTTGNGDMALATGEWRGLRVLMYLPLLLNTPPFRWVPAELHSVELLREVYGNPCRRVRFEGNWRTDTVRTLSRRIHDAREFGALPILADALQDAGCDNEELLAHCRDPRQAHVRGCWAIDVVLEAR